MKVKTEGIALEFAGFWRRAAAFIIDLIALGFITSLFTPFRWFGISGFWETNTISDTQTWLIFPILVASEFVSLIIVTVYFVGFWVWRGQTPGKMVAGIKLINIDGTKLTIGTALLRFLGYIVSTAIMLLGFVWIAFDRRKQGLHDKMADTYVVKIPEEPAQPEIQQAAGA